MSMGIGTFVARLAKWQSHVEVNNKRILKRAGEMLEREAKSAIGTYKYGWPRLSAKTVARKRTGDSPLLETGGLRASYGHTMVDDHNVEMGTNDQKAVWQELGTSRIPPRPVVSNAAQRQGPHIAKMAGEGLKTALES